MGAQDPFAAAAYGVRTAPHFGGGTGGNRSVPPAAHAPHRPAGGQGRRSARVLQAAADSAKAPVPADAFPEPLFEDICSHCGHQGAHSDGICWPYYPDLATPGWMGPTVNQGQRAEEVFCARALQRKVGSRRDAYQARQQQPRQQQQRPPGLSHAHAASAVLPPGYPALPPSAVGGNTDPSAPLYFNYAAHCVLPERPESWYDPYAVDDYWPPAKELMYGYDSSSSASKGFEASALAGAPAPCHTPAGHPGDTSGDQHGSSSAASGSMFAEPAAPLAAAAARTRKPAAGEASSAVVPEPVRADTVPDRLPASFLLKPPPEPGAAPPASKGGTRSAAVGGSDSSNTPVVMECLRELQLRLASLQHMLQPSATGHPVPVSSPAVPVGSAVAATCSTAGAELTSGLADAIDRAASAAGLPGLHAGTQLPTKAQLLEWLHKVRRGQNFELDTFVNASPGTGCSVVVNGRVITDAISVVDSGANIGLASRRWLKQHGIPTAPSPFGLQLADSGVHQVSGMTAVLWLVFAMGTPQEAIVPFLCFEVAGDSMFDILIDKSVLHALNGYVVPLSQQFVYSYTDSAGQTLRHALPVRCHGAKRRSAATAAAAVTQAPAESGLSGHEQSAFRAAVPLGRLFACPARLTTASDATPPQVQPVQPLGRQVEQAAAV